MGLSRDAKGRVSVFEADRIMCRKFILNGAQWHNDDIEPAEEPGIRGIPRIEYHAKEGSAVFGRAFGLLNRRSLVLLEERIFRSKPPFC